YIARHARKARREQIGFPPRLARPASSARLSCGAIMSEPISEQVTGEDPGDKIIVYWEREYSTAIAPERLKLDFTPHRPLLSGMSLAEQRTVAVEGYKVIPDDC